MAWFFQRCDLSYGVWPAVLQNRPAAFCITEVSEQNKRSGILTTQFFSWELRFQQAADRIFAVNLIVTAVKRKQMMSRTVTPFLISAPVPQINPNVEGRSHYYELST